MGEAAVSFPGIDGELQMVVADRLFSHGDVALSLRDRRGSRIFYPLSVSVVS